jgi:cell division protein FtsW
LSSLAKYIRGDRVIWTLAVILSLMSFLSVYSASSNIAFSNGVSHMTSIMLKHLMYLITGFSLMYLAHNIPHKYYGNLSRLLLPIAILLLIITLAQGTTIGGANAARWLRLPFGLSFQTSSFASLVLLAHMARYLSKNAGKELGLKESFLPLLLPLFIVCGLVLPANFSTAAIIFTIAVMLMFVGSYPLKNIAILLGSGALSLLLFIAAVKAFPKVSNRVQTWEQRIQSFMTGDAEVNYQVHKAKMAIAEGGLLGVGSGKSVQKNFLPQSNSDFIYAVIVEEYGLIGGLAVLILYLLLFMRILKVATKATTLFGSLLTVAAGSGILIQAFVNMGVAVNVFPVTGQTLPLISAGGSSIWMSCLALGMILSVSRSYMGEEAAIRMTDEDLPENPFETELSNA